MPEDETHERIVRDQRHKYAYGRFILWHGLLTALLVLLISAGLARAEGRPIGDDRTRVVVVSLLATGAGCCLGGLRIMLRSLRRDAGEPVPADPTAQALVRQFRLLRWAGVLQTSLGFALLLLFALSIGCERPGWVAWWPGRRP